MSFEHSFSRLADRAMGKLRGPIVQRRPLILSLLGDWKTALQLWHEINACAPPIRMDTLRKHLHEACRVGLLEKRISRPHCGAGESRTVYRRKAVE